MECFVYFILTSYGSKSVKMNEKVVYKIESDKYDAEMMFLKGGVLVG